MFDHHDVYTYDVVLYKYSVSMFDHHDVYTYDVVLKIRSSV